MARLLRELNVEGGIKGETSCMYHVPSTFSVHVILILKPLPNEGYYST